MQAECTTKSRATIIEHFQLQNYATTLPVKKEKKTVTRNWSVRNISREFSLSRLFYRASRLREIIDYQFHAFLVWDEAINEPARVRWKLFPFIKRTTRSRREQGGELLIYRQRVARFIVSRPKKTEASGPNCVCPSYHSAYHTREHLTRTCCACARARVREREREKRIHACVHRQTWAEGCLRPWYTLRDAARGREKERCALSEIIISARQSLTGWFFSKTQSSLTFYKYYSCASSFINKLILLE